MKKSFAFFAACALAATVMNAQNFEWAKSFGGADGELSRGLYLDASGNIYIAGFFAGTVDFDPGAGTYYLTSEGYEDAFVQKLDASGNFLWVISFGGGGEDLVRSFNIDASGNVYTTGYFQGTVDFDPGAGIYNLTSAGQADAFVQKLDAAGNFVWAKSFGGAGGDRAYSISIDASGNIYTTGWFYGTSDFDPGAGTYNLSSTGNLDVFIQKLDALGNFVWAKSFGGIGPEEGFSLSIDALGNVYTAGYFNGTTDFDPGVGTYYLTSIGGTWDIFVQKLDASGNFVWAKSFGSEEGADAAYSLSIDASGNVYTTGWFYGTVDFNPGAGTHSLTSVGAKDVFVQKLDASGNFVWAKSFGGTDGDAGLFLSIDASGNIYTTGSFSGTVDFDPGTGTYNLTSAGHNDVFIQKLDASGNFVWAKSFGGADLDGGNSLSIDASGNIYTAGWFQGTVDFDPGAGTYNLISEGGNDVFIHKMSQPSVGVVESDFGKQLVIHPNPSAGDFVIDLGHVYDLTEIAITDMNGKLVYASTLHQTQTANISLKKAPAGVYLLRIQSGKKRAVVKLVKD